MKICTHSGGFHADEVFAVAALLLLFPDSDVVRTREKSELAHCDACVDVGGVHNPAKNLFDHHQEGGAGKGEHGIPYSSFGLVWKTYGEKLCGSAEIAKKIEQEIIEPIDANDVGVDISTSLIAGINHFDISRIINRFRPYEEEGVTADDAFTKAIAFAKEYLLREIAHSKDELKAKQKVEETYKNSDDKRILIFNENISWESSVMYLPEVLFVIYPNNFQWRVKAVRKNWEKFESRKLLPESWRGKISGDLARVSGVEDALFCHLTGFTGGALSKEGALQMARIAVDN